MFAFVSPAALYSNSQNYYVSELTCEVHRIYNYYVFVFVIQWFYDTRQPGVLELAGAISTTENHPITSGSALVLLHDQDIVGKTWPLI